MTSGMVTDWQVGQPIGRGEAAVEGAGAFGGLGGVLGDVASDLGVRHVAVGGDRPYVELAAPGQGAGREAWRGGRRDADSAGGLVDGGSEQGEGGPGRRGRGWPGGTVGPGDGGGVGHAASLVLGNPGGGDPDLGG